MTYRFAGWIKRPKLKHTIERKRSNSTTGAHRRVGRIEVTFEEFSAIARLGNHLRPYHVENTSSRPITEVKQRRAWLVLGWVTAWEYQVL